MSDQSLTTLKSFDSLPFEISLIVLPLLEPNYEMLWKCVVVISFDLGSLDIQWSNYMI